MYERIEDTIKRPSTCVKIVKVLTYLSAALLSVFGLLGLVFMILNNIISSKFFLVFSPIFIILFGLVIVAVELKMKFVLASFDFLQTLLGKGLFYIYLSSSVFYFFSCGYENIVLAWTSAMILFGLGALFTFLHFTNGQYTDQVKEKLTQI